MKRGMPFISRVWIGLALAILAVTKFFDFRFKWSDDFTVLGYFKTRWMWWALALLLMFVCMILAAVTGLRGEEQDGGDGAN